MTADQLQRADRVLRQTADQVGVISANVQKLTDQMRNLQTDIQGLGGANKQVLAILLELTHDPNVERHLQLVLRDLQVTRVARSKKGTT